MFEKLKLWYWHWFRPAKRVHHLAEELVAAYEAGLQKPDPAVVASVAGLK